MRLRVRDLRATKGWTQADLAAAAGVRPATISKAENEPETMELRTLMQIAKALGVDVADLFDAGGSDVRDMVRLFGRLRPEDRAALTRQAEALVARGSERLSNGRRSTTSEEPRSRPDSPAKDSREPM